ncbi:MAG: hypothetical protein M3Y40_06180 [Chloroflexota bacterium]|nr:hypothetical protein [Chloroflexota bacterium]
MRISMRWLVALVLAAVLGACVTDSRPESSACAAPAVTLEMRLTATELTPAPSVCRDQEVTLRIASEVDGVFHIHGYEQAVSATEVVAGETLELTFTADTVGQYPIELHPADDPSGVSIAIFTVNEP